MSVPQSLPSFAQAFSSSSLSEITHISNALPPIQRQKRTRDRPTDVRVKEEDSPPVSPPLPSDAPRDDDATPAVQPSSKKRRVTVSAIPNPSPPVSPATNHASLLGASPPGDQLTRIGRVSPIPVVSRPNPASQPITPPPLMSQESASKPQQVAAAHSLPPPPISFARRRAAQPGARKKKPADILISPRGAGPSDPLAPVIQSAPPVADPGRFPMAIPRLPIMFNSAQTTRRVASNVPPTPTRFSLQNTQGSAPSISSTARTMPSPPNPSVPIANTLVPPTPHALHHHPGDKSAFLAPFEVFYDALNDSKQLKTWLSDQLQKSNTLMVTLKQQQEKMDEIVEDLVEKRTRVMREEIAMLRQRMESLEEALLAVRAESSAREQDGEYYPQGTKFHQNGIPPGPDTSSSTYEREHPSVSPPVEVTRRPEAPLHSTFSLHNRSTSGPQGSAKATPVRPQERFTETRTTSRMWTFTPGDKS